MITPEEKAYLHTKAYVPEHIVSLMVPISKGEPFLKEDHLGFVKDNWVILVGYPLDGKFSKERCERILKEIVKIFRPEYLWFIGPEIPAFLLDSCKEIQTDQYYKLELEQIKLKPSLQRATDKASNELTVERERSISKEHRALVAELLKREELPSIVKELYHAMPDYVPYSSSAIVLNARDKKGKLCAFYVVELGAKDFSTYVLGTYSKKHYVPYASDLLFLEMIKITREHGKNVINLGLGVNKGIRRFKEKWGGVPFLNYEFCECFFGYTRTISLIKTIEGKL
jgi:lipid II:glycine glycyltransferase (peptidoglycan interpeptide bridge formation enzyme)